MNSASPTPAVAPAAIPDHTLLRVIGRGSYGEVWLAHNVMGTPRAVKIVRRDAFDSERPYLREFEGIRRSEPVSRAHDGLLDILQVGRHVEEGWFYYVMELADARDGDADDTTYRPMTLAARIEESPRLDATACLRLAESLAGALAFLHERGLIHRDVKPSNILYARGVPKLGDIGLVAEAGSSRSFVGTEGFVPLEGPGTERADIYALGKVLYEALTGLDRECYPRLPPDWADAPDFRQRVELNEIVLRACEGNAAKRYKSARELLADVALVASGRSVRRLRGLENRLRLLKAAGGAALVLACLGTVAVGLLRRERQRSAALETARQQQASAAASLQDANARLQESIDRSELDRAEGHFSAGEPTAGMALLLGILRHDPGHPVAGPRLASALWSGLFALPHHPPWLVGSKVVHLRLLRDGTELLVGTQDGVFTLDATTGERIAQFERAGTAALFDGFASTPDNESLAAWNSSPGGVLTVYDVATGKMRGAPIVHARRLHGASFSDDGSAMVAVDDGPELHVYDARTGLPSGPPLANGVPAWDAALSPDGYRLAATAGNRVRIWDTRTRQQSLDVSPGGREIVRVRFSPDGRLLLVGDADGKMQFVDAASGRPAGGVMRHGAEFRAATFSRDGTKLLVASNDRSARLWSVPDGAALSPPLRHRDAVNFAVFDAGETRIVTGGLDILTRVWDPESGRQITQPLPHFEQPRTAVCAPDGPLFYVGGADGLINCWDLPSVSEATRFVVGKSAEFSPDGRLLALAASAQPVVDAATLQPVPWLPAFPQAPRLACFSPDGKRIALAFSQSVSVREIGHPEQRPQEISIEGKLTALAFSPTGPWLAAGTESGRTLLWDLRDGQLAPSPPPQEDPVTLVRFSPDGATLLTATSSRPQTFRPSHFARLWKIPSARPLGQPIMHRDDILDGAFSPGGSTVLVAGRDNVAQICDARTGRPLCAPLGHVRVVSAATYSPDGRVVATASWDGTVRLWDARTGTSLATPLSHDDRVTDCRFSPDGQRLATGARDGTVRLWHAATGQPLTDAIPLKSPVTQLRWHPDGETLVVSTEAGRAHRLDVPRFTGPQPAWLIEIASVLSQGELSRDPSAVWALATRSLTAKTAALAAPPEGPHGRLARRLFGR